MGTRQIFISYRRRDAAGHAGRLYDRLTARFGQSRVFMDIDSIPPGADFVELIKETISACDVLIVVIGNEWLTTTAPDGRRRIDDPNDFVRLEIEAALQNAVTIIPARVEGAAMPDPAHLPPAVASLARRNAIELTDERWTHDVDRLIAAIEGTISAEDPVEPAPGDGHRLRRQLVAAAAAVLLTVGGVAFASRAGWFDGDEQKRKASSSSSSRTLIRDGGEDGSQTHPTPSADLSIEVLTSASSVAVGEILSYKVQITNAGPGAAESATIGGSITGVDVEFLGPPMADQGTCTADASGAIACDLGDIAHQAAITVVVDLIPRSSGTVVASFSGHSDVNDPDGADGSASTPVT